MKITTSPVKGMRDFTPKELELRHYVSQTILDIYKTYGFAAIETPVMDDIKLLTGGQGGENEKLIFKILKRGEKLDIQQANTENDLVDFGLRFDLTVPLTRFYVQHRNQLAMPFKAIQMGSVWRAERPQKGRFRQFVQCDIDIIGVADNSAEIELISATTQALLALGFQDFKVRLNDRRILEELVDYCGFPNQESGKVFIIFDKLDKIGLDGIQKELIESGFEEKSVQKLAEIVQKLENNELNQEILHQILPNLDKNISNSLYQILHFIKKNATNFQILHDLSLVRGMGYYTGTIFEVEIPQYGSSVAGGGRYDKMIGRYIKGEEVPACGFSIGFERITQILEENNFQIPNKTQKIVLLYEKNEDLDKIFAFAQKERQAQKTVFLVKTQKNRSKQLDLFAEQGFDSYIFWQNEQVPEIRLLTKK